VDNISIALSLAESLYHASGPVLREARHYPRTRFRTWKIGLFQFSTVISSPNDDAIFADYIATGSKY